jgi:hypothetical protein
LHVWCVGGRHRVGEELKKLPPAKPRGIISIRGRIRFPRKRKLRRRSKRASAPAHERGPPQEAGVDPEARRRGGDIPDPARAGEE